MNDVMKKVVSLIVKNLSKEELIQFTEMIDSADGDIFLDDLDKELQKIAPELFFDAYDCEKQ